MMGDDAPGPLSRPALPIPATDLVGREADAAAVAALLRAGGTRLVTFTGPGGVGKTRLALAVAAREDARCRGGVVFVDLSLVREPALVPTVTAAALGQPHEESPAPRRSPDALLVLDNFEHVVEAAPIVAELLAARPSLRVLVTSREPLRLAAERVFPVEPLPVPPADRAAAGNIAANPAVDLFVRRARAADPAFALTRENAPVVAAVVRRLDGLPLAIELAAARVRVLPPAALLARLNASLRLLTGGPRDAPERQRTIRDAIAWSHDLLPPDERVLFRRLGVFVGGFTLAAAEAVSGCAALEPGTSNGLSLGAGLPPPEPRHPPPDTLDAISSLLDKGLLRRADKATEQPRYTMLETVREFALEQLEASGEADVARERHAAFFAELAEAAASDLAADPACAARLASVLPNLRAASAWALDRGRFAWALRLGTATRSYSGIHEGDAEALRLIAAALAVPGDAHVSTRIDALWANASISSLANLAPAAALAEAAAAEADAAGDRYRAAKARDLHAVVAEYTGDHALAIALCEAGLADLDGLPTDAAVEELRRFLTDNLADNLIWSGDVTRGARLAEANLVGTRRLGHPWAIAQAIQPVAAAANMRGDQPTAAALYEELFDLRRSLGDRAGLAGALGGLAGVAAALGQPERAARLLGAAGALRAEVGVRYGPHYARGPLVESDLRRRLAPDAVEAARAEGAAWPAERATAEARAVIAEARSAGKRAATDDAIPHGLTPRERDVLRLLAAGKTDAQIADALFVSRRTVTTHTSNLFAKLGVANRAEAAALAAREGLA